MGAQGSLHSQYRRAVERKNLMGAETLLREMGSATLEEALDYLALLAGLRPAKAARCGALARAARDRSADAHDVGIGACASGPDRPMPG